MNAPNPILTRYLAVLPELSQGTDLCRACVTVLPIQRAAIMLHTEAGSWELLSASDDTAERIESAQITTGDGPGVDAMTQGVPITETDLAARGYARWAAWLTAMDGDAPAAVFTYPLHFGAIRLGVLDLYCDTAMPFSDDDFASMTLIAHAITMILLTGTDQHSDAMWHGRLPSTRTTHQATGMIMAQLDVSAREAYLRLQGYAFAEGKLLGEVAEDVVARRLRLPPN